MDQWQRLYCKRMFAGYLQLVIAVSKQSMA
jgi:hypothetical protein